MASCKTVKQWSKGNSNVDRSCPWCNELWKHMHNRGHHRVRFTHHYYWLSSHFNPELASRDKRELFSLNPLSRFQILLRLPCHRTPQNQSIKKFIQTVLVGLKKDILNSYRGNLQMWCIPSHLPLLPCLVVLVFSLDKFLPQSDPTPSPSSDVSTPRRRSAAATDRSLQ